MRLIKNKNQNFDDRFGPTALFAFLFSGICVIAALQWNAPPLITTLSSSPPPPSGQDVFKSPECIVVSDGTTLTNKFTGTLSAMVYMTHSAFSSSGVVPSSDQGSIVASSFMVRLSLFFSISTSCF